MIDPKLLRENPEQLRSLLKSRNSTMDCDALIKADADRRALQTQVDELRAKKNTCAEQYGKLKKSGAGESPEGTALMDTMRKTDTALKDLEQRQTVADATYMNLLLLVPNLPDASVPVGTSSDHNVEIRRWGTPRQFSFTPKSHWEIGEALGLLDLPRAARMSGARFPLFLGLGARLMRALIQCMLDMHTNQHGYTEVSPPLLVKPESLQSTGQLPLLADDMYKTQPPDNLWLIPTGEVPLVNIHREEILDGARLPIKYVGYTPCFRQEAGSYGKDIRGLIRQHQFDKVEMVQFVKPEDSLAALEEMTAHAEAVLQALELPYQIMLLSTGQTSLASMKTYDPEVWMPGQNTHREVSSCSTCGDFQARRAQIRFRRNAKSKPELVHTLNGSGLAVGRTFAALLENFQNADGSVTIPERLRPYMNGLDSLTL